MTTLNEARPGAGVVWALVEEGFHVGSRNGEFLGYIERQKDGRFAASNMYSQIIGTFADLPSAMSAVSSDLPVVPTRTPRRWRSR